MLQRGQVYDRAITTFQEVIDRYPNVKRVVENAHVSIAECLHRMGKPDEAMAYAKKLYEEQPEMRAPALLAQGILCQWSGKPEEALIVLQRVVSEYPNYSALPLAKSFLIPALQKTGRTDEAVRLLKESLAGYSDPQEIATCWLDVGHAYYEAKRHRDALDAFKEVRDLKGVPAERKAKATYQSALCYQGIKYYSSARTCMGDVVKLYPEGEWANKARGALHVWANYGPSTEIKP